MFFQILKKKIKVADWQPFFPVILSYFLCVHKFLRDCWMDLLDFWYQGHLLWSADACFFKFWEKLKMANWWPFFLIIFRFLSVYASFSEMAYGFTWILVSRSLVSVSWWSYFFKFGKKIKMAPLRQDWCMSCTEWKFILW